MVDYLRKHGFKEISLFLEKTAYYHWHYGYFQQRNSALFYPYPTSTCVFELDQIPCQKYNIRRTSSVVFILKSNIFQK